VWSIVAKGSKQFQGVKFVSCGYQIVLVVCFLSFVCDLLLVFFFAGSLFWSFWGENFGEQTTALSSSNL
jgi:hypothetical protein